MDLDSYFAELSAEAPCGENLEYDPAYGALERALQGKPETQYGKETTPAEPPDWKGAKGMALELLGRSRDLRIALAYAQAALNTDGITGFADGIGLLTGLVERRWDSVHPQLDPDDNNDPTIRVNVLSGLTVDETLRALREAALVQSRVHGHFNLRDFEYALGELPAVEGVTVHPIANIEAAFMEAEADTLAATANAIEVGLAHAAKLESILTDKVGVGNSIDFEPLRKMLKRQQTLVAERRAARGDIAAPQAEGEGAGGDGAPRGAALSGEVRSREDVIRALDIICEYYRRSEPSSPVPFMLQRAKKLVPLSFYDIINDLAPDGVSQVERVLGISNESS